MNPGLGRFSPKLALARGLLRMRVTVELFGIARLRAGVSQTEAHGSNLGDVFSDLASVSQHWLTTAFRTVA